MKKYVAKMTNKGGYTIVELMVAIAISGIFMGTIYSAYTSQQRATLGQEQVSAMQRNLRSAMYFMEREIRMAGCDPTGNAKIDVAGSLVPPGIIQANASLMEFAADADGDGTIATNERIIYSLSGANLQRNGQRIAENIDAVNFVYLDGDSPPQPLNPGMTDVSESSIPDIRSVQVTVVARTGKEDRRYTDSTSYQNKISDPIFTPSGDAVYFRRKVLSTNIKCRNLGL
jgi:prepilin-type N-terminal cleavage/methylation domain-containing protein